MAGLAYRVGNTLVGNIRNCDLNSQIHIFNQSDSKQTDNPVVSVHGSLSYSPLSQVTWLMDVFIAKYKDARGQLIRSSLCVLFVMSSDDLLAAFSLSLSKMENMAHYATRDLTIKVH